MATIKAFSDLQQSRKLAEILPLESADMYWDYDVQKHEYYPMVMDEQFDDTCICAWSLAALLGVLPTLDGRNAVLCKDIRYNEWHICYHSTATLSVIDTERYDNPVDACYEMIIRLNELKVL